MTLLKLSNLSWLALFAATAATGNTACSSNPGPAPKAYAAVLIMAGGNPGVNDVPACGGGDFNYTVGAATAGMPMDYADGTDHAGKVSVYCTVDSNGGGFDVNLSVEIAAAMGGTLSVSGHVNATGSSTGLNATFETMGQLFRDNDCTFSQVYNGAPIPSNAGPASGRIWGHLDCPNAMESGMFGQGADGGAVTKTCDGSADFLFENCN
ncbi:MAG: hypothetical protein ACRENE_20480 [Polyangiaceae bacterium]